MKIQTISKQNFNGQMIIVDRFGKVANKGTQKVILEQLGASVFDLRRMIAQKKFNLYISRNQIDYIDICANKTPAGIIKGETTKYSLHKSTLNNIIKCAEKTITEYETYMQKHV